MCSWIRNLLVQPQDDPTTDSVPPIPQAPQALPDPPPSATPNPAPSRGLEISETAVDGTKPPTEEETMHPVPEEKKKVIDQVLSVFETGSSEPSYSKVVFLDDGAGITYGKHQSTDGGGALDQIVMKYIDYGGKYADELRQYLPLLADDETTKANPDDLPKSVKELMNLLQAAGEDPLMQAAQDKVFDEHYWDPAISQAWDMGLTLPLSWLVCYDSTIHSGSNGIARIRKRFAALPPSRGGDEKRWTKAYLEARRAWLASHPNPVVQNTVYRIDSMLQLIEDDNWMLDVPFILLKPKRMING